VYNSKSGAEVKRKRKKAPEEEDAVGEGARVGWCPLLVNRPTLDDVHHQASLDHSPSVSHRPRDENLIKQGGGEGVNKKKGETKQKNSM
jgi:hypothetical protein